MIETKPLTASMQTELMASKLQPESCTVVAEWEWMGAACPVGAGTVAKLVV